MSQKHKQDSNTPPQELYGGLETPNAALASSRAFLPRTLVKASAKINLPDRYFKSMLCSVNWSRRAAARMQKRRFLHVVTVCKMFAMQPVLSDKSSTLKVLLPMRDFNKFKIAIAVTQPKPAAWISASTALWAARLCLVEDHWIKHPLSTATTPDRLLLPPGAKLASALTLSSKASTWTAWPWNTILCSTVPARYRQT